MKPCKRVHTVTLVPACNPSRRRVLRGVADKRCCSPQRCRKLWCSFPGRGLRTRSWCGWTWTPRFQRTLRCGALTLRVHCMYMLQAHVCIRCAINSRAAHAANVLFAAKAAAKALRSLHSAFVALMRLALHSHSSIVHTLLLCTHACTRKRTLCRHPTVPTLCTRHCEHRASPQPH